MRDDFAVFIITHGRPHNQLTYNFLVNNGYSGRTYFVVDDEDKTLDEYIEKYGAEAVKTFHKTEWFDIGDNLYQHKNSSVFGRNECFKIAEDMQLKYFVELDDDFTDISFRYDDGERLRTAKVSSFDDLFDAFCIYLDTELITCLSFATAGDGIGGREGPFSKKITRKARNVFFCKTGKPFEFKGRFEDIVTPAWYNMTGEIFMTILDVQVHTLDKAKNTGGMAEMKNQNISYWERFYPVMWLPSAVKIIKLSNSDCFEERVSFNNLIPKILNVKCKKMPDMERQKK